VGSLKIQKPQKDMEGLDFPWCGFAAFLDLVIW